MKINKEELLEIFDQESSITSTAREYCKRNNIEYSDNVRRKVSYHINKENISEPINDIDNYTETETNQYENKTNVLSAVNPNTNKYMDIWDFCDYYGIPKEHVKSYKAVNSQNGGVPTYNIASHILRGDYFEEFYQNLLKEIEEIGNKPSTIYRQDAIHAEDGHLLVVDPADIHIGKLCDSFEVGEDYNNQIAVNRVKEGVAGIIEKSKGFRIDKILFIAGNDVLHIDTPKRTTTSGTPQDTDGQWYSNFLIAKQLYIEVLLDLLKIADIHFMYNPSNHDYQTGFFLSDVIKTYFKDVKNITFDTSISHRKYFKYGSNLIGGTHGDGAKQTDLPLLMADECEYWSECKHRYIYGHHVHHKISKDYIGVTFETLRSPSGTDSWHHRNGYSGVPKAIEAFIHHPKFGQVARITHLF